MSSWRYPSCNDWRDHQRDGERDARSHSHFHQPSPFGNRDCRAAYDDAYRAEQRREEDRQQERAEEERQEWMAEQRRQEYLREQDVYMAQEQEREPDPIQPEPKRDEEIPF